MEQETIAQTMLDQLVTDENSQMLKALIPSRCRYRGLLLCTSS